MVDKIQILIVEDEPDMRQNLCELLKDDYDVVAVEDGEKAIRFLDRDFDTKIVLLDIRMPNMSGIDVLKRIKQMVPPREVIMVTAFNDIQTAVECMRLGAYDYIIKPFLADELLHTVKRVSEKWTMAYGLLDEYWKGNLERIDSDRRLVFYEEQRMKKYINDEILTPAEIAHYIHPNPFVTVEQIKESFENIYGKGFFDKRIKVLVVDDEAAVREIFNEMLSSQYDLAFAKNGEIAIELAQSNNFDVILLDLRLPDVDGIELIKKIRSITDARVIVVTVIKDVEFAVESLKNGAYDYITKPFNKEDITFAIARAVEKKLVEDVFPKLNERLRAERLSFEKRLDYLNQFCEKRLAAGKSMRIKDIKVFFPELKIKHLSEDMEIPVLTFDTGLKEFIDKLFKNEEIFGKLL